MQKIFQTLLIIIFILSFLPNEIFSQFEYRTIPLVLKPEAEINKIQDHWIKTGFAKYREINPLPYEDLEKEFRKNPPKERILNEDGGFELIDMSNASSQQSETWIRINDTDPNNIIGTSNDGRALSYQSGYVMYAFYTTDGGNTWKQSKTPQNLGLYIDPNNPNQPWQMTIFDPGITFDTKGTAYYSYGFTQTHDETSGHEENGVFVSRSYDKGKTWEEPIPVVLELGSSNLPFNDRYTITADINEESPFKDNIYISWQRFIKNRGVVFSRTENGGESWSNPIILPGTESLGTQAPVPEVGPGGVIYVAYRVGSGIYDEARIQKSTDGGITWTGSVTAQRVIKPGEEVGSRSLFPEKQKMRVSAYPAIAVDNSDGPRRGWIYVVQAGKDQTGNYGVFLARSTDNGKKWQNMIRIDNSTLRNDMFFPAITVDRVTGAVSVLYYSSQNDPDNEGVDAYLAYAEDGVNFSVTRLTPETWYIDGAGDVSPQGEDNNYYWGDYTSIHANNGLIWPCFWMPSPLTGNINSLELYTAKIATWPKPVQDLQLSSDFNKPDEVQITWIDPTENSLGGTLNDFKVLVYRDGKKIDEVDNGVQIYTDKGLSDGSEYHYTLFVQNASGTSVPESGSVFAGGSPVPNPISIFYPKPADNGILVVWENPAEHIDGSIAHDLSRVEIYVDGELSQSVSDNIQAGEMSSHLIELETGKFYNIKLKAVGKRGSVETESLFSNELIGYAGAPADNISENFDGNEVTAFYTDRSWAVTDIASHSAPNCLTDSPDGDYEEGINSVYIKPVIASEAAKTIHFWHVCIIDGSETDYGTMDVSTDFGNTWKNLYWGDMELHPDQFKSDIKESEFLELSRSIEEFIGDTVMIRFRVVANFFRNEDGWYIDDLGVDDSPVSVEEKTPADNMIAKVLPNPVQAQATLSLKMTYPARLKIGVYNELGANVTPIQSGYYNAGNYNIPINMENLTGGAYFIRISTDKESKTIPVIINR